MKGCTDLTEQEQKLALDQVQVSTMSDRTGKDFAKALDGYLTDGEFDIVIVDPAFSYLGGDASSQKDVGPFLRNLITPLIQKHEVGMVICHHSNKPLRGKEKNGWAAGDFAYLGAGSAEWANVARGVLAVRSVDSDKVFQLIAAKRGRRLGWKDDSGEATTSKYIAHYGEPGVICWRDATPEEIEAVQPQKGPGRQPKCDVAVVLRAVEAKESQNQAYYKDLVKERVGCSANSVQNAISRAVGDGLLKPSKEKRSTLYSLTEAGKKKLETVPKTHHFKTTDQE
jgi:predicted transcriptional regulator